MIGLKQAAQTRRKRNVSTSLRADKQSGRIAAGTIREKHRLMMIINDILLLNAWYRSGLEPHLSVLTTAAYLCFRTE